MFKHCLFCTDFSDGFQRFASHIKDLYQSGLRKFVFLHTVSVWEDEHLAGVDQQKIQEAKDYLAAQLQDVPADVEVKIEVSLLRYLDKIHQLIEQEAIDLIIVGMTVKNNLEVTLFGSHTLALVRSTAVPVMILRPQVISTFTTEEIALRSQHLWQHLLVPFDDSPAGQYLIENLTNKLAAGNDNNYVSSCRLLWVVEENPRNPTLVENRVAMATEKLGGLAEILKAYVPQVYTEVRMGNPLTEILDAAFVYDTSAIAVGSYRKTILDWTVPSVADDIVRQSWFPILFLSPAR